MKYCFTFPDKHYVEQFHVMIFIGKYFFNQPLYQASIIYHLLLYHLRYFSPFILLVAQLWFKTCFTYGILDGFISKSVRRTGSTYYIFFNHDGAKIIGAGMQTNLRSLFSYRKPACLYIFNIGKHDAAYGDHADIFFRRGKVVHAPDPCQ